MTILVILSILTLIATVACIYIGIKFDPNGKKPYIILPTVVGSIGLMILQVFILLKIYPYAKEHDKKKLRNKTFNSINLQMSLDSIKQSLISNFELSNGKYIKYEKQVLLKINYELNF